MSLRAAFLRFLHRLLRVPLPEPVVQERVRTQAWAWYVPQLVSPGDQEFRHVPLSPEDRFTIRHRSTSTVQ